MESKVKCAGCHQPILDRYLLVKGQIWHPNCFVCQYCHYPLLDGRRTRRERLAHAGAYVEHDGQCYHAACYAKAFNKVCDVCAAPLLGRYFTDGRGYQFCAHHSQSIPRCFSCQRLICQSITQGGIRLQDGRALCAVCLPNAITNQDLAQRAFACAKQFMKQARLDVSEYNIPLELTDQHGMRGRLTRTERGLDGRRPACGQTRILVHKRGKQVVGRSVGSIAILHHLSELHFTSIAVHELGHAWLFYNGFSQLPIRVEEGFCVFLEYCYLKHTVEKLAAPGSTLHSEASFLMRMIEENQDPVYGYGFRAANDAIKKHGFSTTLKALQEKKYWPGTSPLRDDLRDLWRMFFRPRH